MKNIKQKKCKNCKGTGFVQIAKDVKGLVVCPICKGAGTVEEERRYYCKTCRDLMCSFSGKDRYEINCSGVEED